jgi:hypothetical protein
MGEKQKRCSRRRRQEAHDRDMLLFSVFLNVFVEVKKTKTREEERMVKLQFRVSFFFFPQHMAGLHTMWQLPLNAGSFEINKL